jgi:chorismate mutase
VSKIEAAYAQAAQIQKHPRCGVALLLEKVDPDERKALVAAFADPTRSRAVLSEAIRAAYKADIPQQTIARHMRRHCRCPR